jgi:hypothetical protein
MTRELGLARELLPCPFCGGAAHIEQVGEDLRFCDWEITCNGQWCGVSVTTGDEARAREHWNRRTLPDTASRSEGVDRADHAIALATNENLRIRLASCEAALEAAYTSSQLPASAGEGDAKDAALTRFEAMCASVDGCSDGGCVIKRPTGMHTNGGCSCYGNKIKAQRIMRAAQELRTALAPPSTGSKESQ